MARVLVVYELIIYKVPNVPGSRERLLAVLWDKALDDSLSRVLTLKVKNNHAFMSMDDLRDNEQILDAWDGMHFGRNRLRFKISKSA